ncbi:MAG: TIGR04086 family membrane protein [Acidobacteriia bacterium]|nr:TIGR04086 family membrane protein [Terriglobia bacterium]
MANIRWGRVILAAIAAEVGVILLLVAASTVFKVSSESAGYYVAPPASAVATFLMVLWVARKLESRFVLHGLLVGVVGVVLTAGFIFTAKPEDRWMYVVSFVLRIVGGYLGGLVAQKPAAIREAQLQ